MIIVAIQDDIRNGKDIDIVRQYGIKEWVYFGEDSSWRVKAEMTLLSDLKRVSIAKQLEHWSWELREEYIEWIGRLSLDNNCVEWWAGELGAKNPFSMLYLRVCLLAVARNLIERRGQASDTLYVVSTPALYSEIVRSIKDRNVEVREYYSLTRDTASAKLRGIVGYVVRRMMEWRQTRIRMRRFLSQRLKQLMERKHLLNKYQVRKLTTEESRRRCVIIATWVDERNFAIDGKYVEPHLGPIPGILDREGHYICYFARVLGRLDFELAIEKLEKTKVRYVTPEMYLEPEDIEKIYKRVRKYRPRVSRSDNIRNIPLYKLAKEHVVDTFTSTMNALEYEAIIRNMAAEKTQPVCIIHTCEGHPWEQCMTWSVKQNLMGTNVFGFANLTFSPLVLSMYPYKWEFDIRPLPTKLLVNGEIFRNQLESEGWPEERLIVIGAIRHANAAGRKVWRKGKRSRAGKAKVLVATCVPLASSVDLVVKAVQALGGQEEYQVIVKCHPLIKKERILGIVNKMENIDNVIFTEDPIDEMLAQVDILLYDNTVVCYEALEYSVPPICVMGENFLNLDKLKVREEVRWVATTPEEIREAVKEILGMDRRAIMEWRKKAERAFRDAFAPVDEDKIRRLCVDESDGKEKLIFRTSA